MAETLAHPERYAASLPSRQNHQTAPSACTTANYPLVSHGPRNQLWQMAPKRKQPNAPNMVGKWLGVPTSFFGVEIEGARYLARVLKPHASKKGMVWMRFEVDGMEVFAPEAVVRGWTITEREAHAEDAEWYEDPPADEDEAEQEQAAAAAAEDTNEQMAPKGKMVAGRWQPADTPRPPHAVDSLQWRVARAGTGVTPIVHPRVLPDGSSATNGFQAPLPIDKC